MGTGQFPKEGPGIARMKRNIAQPRDERRQNDWQDVVSDAEGEDAPAEGKDGHKEDAETGKAEKDSTFGVLESSTVSDLESNRTGSSILIALGSWGTSLISLLGVTPTSKQAQTIYMGFMLVLSLVPILALVIQNGTSLNEVLYLNMRELFWPDGSLHTDMILIRKLRKVLHTSPHPVIHPNPTYSLRCYLRL